VTACSAVWTASSNRDASISAKPRYHSACT
jgi:hypothetical protein